MIKFAKSNAATPVFYSSSGGATPVAATVVLDGAGVPVVASPIDPIWIWADNLNADSNPTVGTYTGVTVAAISEDTGLNWEFSLDGATNWGESIAPVIPSVAAGFQAVRIYARVTAVNDGSIATANYALPDFVVTATENPA